MFRILMIALAALALAGGAAAAAERLGLELNKLEPRDGACRAYIVIENGTPTAFESLKLDLVMFDREGIVAERLALEVAPLPAGKTSLKVFDVAGLACGQVGRVLLNEVLACDDGTGARDGCMDFVETSARGGLEFIK
ncbi:Tat pathway signal sequence domain protein [Minwuia thermotolerans]|uniref:Tat pathway signal sequence domain protein n=1 Tax=Minwuia thermotolerans TaxID=2056226 RepID=A0A2M9FVH7_9PROT|nr:Tat pathway signal sequence domain protein [Minwuia thermotolerans]PJK27429.1 Tat pathway signal sequence domain protein [Minwuia thermotolerans]